MNCTKCGNPYAENAQFCAFCRNPISAANNQGEFVQQPPAVPPPSFAQQQLMQQAINPPEKKRMSAWGIVSIVVGVLAFLGLCCTLATFAFIGFIADEVVDAMDEIANVIDSDISSRNHHYNFAHIDLPIAFFADPEGFMEELAHDYGWQDRLMLHDIWSRTGGELSSGEVLPPDGLGFKIVEDGELIIAAVTMPPAERVPEAIYVAMVLNRETGDAHYFTLEYSFGDSTMLCAWFANRSRQNFGEGPPAGDIDAFIEEVIAHID